MLIVLCDGAVVVGFVIVSLFFPVREYKYYESFPISHLSYFWSRLLPSIYIFITSLSTGGDQGGWLITYAN